LAKAVVATLTVVMSRAAGRELKVGLVVLIQTAGRASNYNPHAHMMVTGGIDQRRPWQDVKTVSYDYLHREWRRQLFARLEETSRSAEVALLLKRLGQEYKRGLVAYWEPKPVKIGKGLAQYLIKYVASPPIVVSRIIAYDRPSVSFACGTAAMICYFSCGSVLNAQVNDAPNSFASKITKSSLIIGNLLVFNWQTARLRLEYQLCVMGKQKRQMGNELV
jgi:Putative transposase